MNGVSKWRGHFHSAAWENMSWIKNFVSIVSPGNGILYWDEALIDLLFIKGSVCDLWVDLSIPWTEGGGVYLINKSLQVWHDAFRISQSLCDVTWWKSLIFPFPDRWVQQFLPHSCLITPVLASCSAPLTWPWRVHGLGNQTGISKTLVQTSDVLEFCSSKDYSLSNFSISHMCLCYYCCLLLEHQTTVSGNTLGHFSDLSNWMEVTLLFLVEEGPIWGTLLMVKRVSF